MRLAATLNKSVRHQLLPLLLAVCFGSSRAQPSDDGGRWVVAAARVGHTTQTCTTACINAGLQCTSASEGVMRHVENQATFEQAMANANPGFACATFATDNWGSCPWALVQNGQWKCEYWRDNFYGRSPQCGAGPPGCA